MQIVYVDFLIPKRLDHQVEIGYGEWCPRNLEDVGAKISDLLLNVNVGALDYRHDGDDCSHTHRQPDQCKNRP
jgi:hypothetical protein